jgi:hypothetical protein
MSFLCQHFKAAVIILLFFSKNSCHAFENPFFVQSPHVNHHSLPFPLRFSIFFHRGFGPFLQEDQDFLSNFILTDEAFADYEKKLQDKSHGGSSLLSDVIFFTGSVAAVAGTILYLSERTR